ncbi:MAG: hypothetical protein MUC95_06075, partial [Spirochaetes bacterium]|nr:hypothetical protein [Spirochaetota bacterium]
MRENNNILIREAFRYFRKKRFNEAILILEKVVSSETRSPYPHFLLCVSLLLNSRLSEADHVMNNLRRIAPGYLPLVELEAFLFLKAAPNSQAALIKYIDMMEKYPRDGHVASTIRIIQRVNDFESFQKDAKLFDHVKIPRPGPRPLFSFKGKRRKLSLPAEKDREPRPSRGINYRKIIVIIFVIFIIACGSYAVFNYVLKNVNIMKTSPNFDAVELDGLRYDLIDKIKKDKPPFFYFADNELLNDFNEAKRLIKNEKYNDALVMINKISNSNANFRVMERADFLRRFIRGIEDREYGDVAINTVVQRPYLYRGIFVKWKGRIANLKRKDGRMFFNLLV